MTENSDEQLLLSSYGGHRITSSAGEPPSLPSKGTPSHFVQKLTLFSVLGGLLFGYDTGVVSGALIKIKDHFNLSDAEQELVVSATVALAIVGAGIGSALRIVSCSVSCCVVLCCVWFRIALPSVEFPVSFPQI